MTKMKIPKYKPKWSEPCLCGSGIKYKNCCKNHLPGFKMGEKYTAAVHENNLAKALIAARADVTQYTILHKSHTAPLMEKGLKPSLLDIDIKALRCAADKLVWFYLRTPCSLDLHSMLDGISNNICDFRWKQNIICLRTYFELYENNNTERAKHIFNEIGPITPLEENVELLQIFLELYSDSLGFHDRIKYLDRILEISEERRDRIQYQSNKAFQYLMIKDKVTAEKLFLDTIIECRKIPPTNSLTSYEQRFFALSLHILGGIKRDKKLQEEAIEQFKTLLAITSFTPFGEADIYRGIGDCHKMSGEWEKAEAAYLYADSLENLPIHTLLVCEAQLGQHKIDAALKTMGKISKDAFSGHELADYIFIHAALHIERKDPAGLLEAKALLNELKGLEPMFNETRLSLLVDVSSLLSNKNPTSNEQKKKSLLERLNEIIMLQPNFFGIGLNVNKLFKDPSDTPPNEN